MRIIVKIWDGKEDSDVIVDVNMELNDNNLGFIRSIIGSYVPQPAMKAGKKENLDPHKMTEKW